MTIHSKRKKIEEASQKTSRLHEFDGGNTLDQHHRSNNMNSPPEQTVPQLGKRNFADFLSVEPAFEWKEELSPLHLRKFSGPDFTSRNVSLE